MQLKVVVSGKWHEYGVFVYTPILLNSLQYYTHSPSILKLYKGEIYLKN